MKTTQRTNLLNPSQIGNEIQVWIQIMEQKNNDRIEKMRERMENELEMKGNKV